MFLISIFSEKLEKRPGSEGALKRFVGWLAGYVFSLSGHRKGVLTHMTPVEVQNPQQDGDLYVIHVSDSNLYQE